MPTIVGGYSVVSLPEYNYEEDTEVELFRTAPKANGVYYAGYQRNEFGEMDDLYRKNVLPSEIRAMYLRVRENQNNGLYDYYVTESYEDAISMKDYLNGTGDHFEVIAIHSSAIEKHLGSREVKGPASFLGYDINADGYSVILSSLFEHGLLFKGEFSLMNENGILKDIGSVSELIDKYASIQETENIEEITVDSVDVVAVYRLC